MASSLRVNAIVPASGTNVAIGTAGGTITYNANVTGVSTFSSGIVVSVGNTEALRTDSNSNIGIKTTSTSGFNGACDDVVISGSADVGLTFHSTSTTGTGSIAFTDTVGSSTQGAINYFHNGDYMIFQTGASERMRIDSSGRVFKPSQVNFMSRGHTNGTGGSGSRTIIYGTVEHNIGSGYNSSNGIFTAPVAGYYMFGYGIFTSGTANRRLSTININSTAKVEVTTEANNDTYTNLAFSGIFYLNANDTANVASTADILTGSLYGNFYGYLLG